MVKDIKLCECGCGQPVAKEGNRFIHGHHIRISNPTTRPEVREKWLKTMHSEKYRKKQAKKSRGRKHTEKTKQKIAEGNKGKYVSEKTRQKQSDFQKGRPFPEESKSKWHFTEANRHWLGREHTKEARDNISKNRKGKCCGKDNPNFGKGYLILGLNNPNWLGGKSFEPYGLEFNNLLKKQIKQRDGYKCMNPLCWGFSEKLDIHHINYDKTDNNLWNLITLCTSCNSRANGDREFWKLLYQQLIQKLYDYRQEEKAV